jgi:glycosyltransferase involved in cell wall biosynthesis
MERKTNIAVIIPTFNNEGTLGSIISGCKALSYDLIVVNDGSTDSTPDILRNFTDITVISFDVNRGKGAALLAGLRYAAGKCYTHAVTIDSDGQHMPEDISLLIDASLKEPDMLWVGSRNLSASNMPGKNTFANRFSNFWFRIQTGIKMEDTQSGFRIYPLKPIENMKFISGRYELELELLVRYAWKTRCVRNIPVRVIYMPEGERVSHFRPFRDFFRISLLNTLFSLVAFLVYWPYRFFRWFSRENIKIFIKENITHSKESNIRIATAIGTGLFFGIIPVWGYQMALSLVAAHFFKLNKVLVLVFANISIPPMIPFILYGSFATGAYVLGMPSTIIPDHLSLSVIGEGLSIYIIGAVVFAVLAGLAGFLLSFAMLTIIRRKR